MAWAIRDAADFCGVIHVNSLHGLPPSRFCRSPFVYTVHHGHDQALSEFYSYHPDVYFITLCNFQHRLEAMPSPQTIYRRIDLLLYEFREKKQRYLSFLGCIAPFKGTHLAIEVAKNCGIPLQIAGEVQPMFREYFDTQVKPHVDGKFIQYVEEDDLHATNELLGYSLALLFPLEWDEPFGSVMLEPIACTHRYWRLPDGAVAEVVSDGVSGYVC